MSSTDSQLNELETAQHLRSVVGRLWRLLRSTEAGSRHGLTPTASGVLLLVASHGPIRLAEVGELEELNPTLLSRTIAGLMAADLVERKVDANDRRSAWVNATPTGKDIAGSIRRERTEAVLAALDRLDGADRARVGNALFALQELSEHLADARKAPASVA
jgi:DNA-binding MarR family transcriptional regulator